MGISLIVSFWLSQESVNLHVTAADIMRYISNNFEDYKVTRTAVFLDLSKAIDTLYNDTLLKKLDHYRICGIGYNWFEVIFVREVELFA